jgi:hypothetical protein
LLSIYQPDRHHSTHALTSLSLHYTHEISYPHPTPTPLHHTQDACQSISAYKFCCQSINLKMVIRTETCSRYLCNKQHISNHQTVVFDSWLIRLNVVCSSRSLLRSAANCARLPLRISKVPVLLCHPVRCISLSSYLSSRKIYTKACVRSSVGQADVGICTSQQYKMVTRPVVGSSSGCPSGEIGCPFNTYGNRYTLVHYGHRKHS